MNWTCATDSAEWSRRMNHTTVAFDNKIWVLGGYDCFGLYKNDVWYSTNGISWTQATDSANWMPREEFASVVYDNKIWILGGNHAGSHKNDVWNSADGVNWLCVTDSADWSPRHLLTSIVFNDKIWVLGGCDGSSRNDVWYSNDGINWTQVTDSAGWRGRLGHTAIVFDNKIWVMGGPSLMFDVWYSTDGANWICATESIGQRVYHTSVVHDNKMWIIGGENGGLFKNDVWYSTGLGIEENEIATPSTRNDFLIYPNPAKSFLAIRLPSTADRKELKIFDVSGKLVKVAEKVTSAQEHKNEVRISLKGMNPGIYFLRIGKETKKFLVVK